MSSLSCSLEDRQDIQLFTLEESEHPGPGLPVNATLPMVPLTFSSKLGVPKKDPKT